MAISYNTGTTAHLDSVTQATNFTFTVPAGVLVNDVMICVVECFTYTSAAPAVATPTSGGGSWTQISTLANSGPSGGLNSYVTAWYRVATASDPNSTFTISFTGTQGATNTFFWDAALASYTGANTVSPIDVSGGAGAAATSITCPTETTNANGDWALYLGGMTINSTPHTIVGPAGSTQRQNFVDSSGVGAAVFDSNGSVGGANTSIGGGTFTNGAGSFLWAGAFTVGLAPAPASVPPLPQPARTRIPQNAPRGRTAGNKGAPVHNPTSGPVFRQAVTALRAKVPRHTRNFSGWTAGTVKKIIQLTNNFEGGTSGTTISAGNSGGRSGAAFDAVTISSGTLAFDNTYAAHGLLSAKVAVAGSGNTADASWTTSLGTRPQIWFRLYLYFTANPGSNARVFAYTSGASNCATVNVSSSGKLFVNDNASSTLFTFTAAIPLNQWFRVEGTIVNSVTGGSASLSLYSPLDSLVAAESHTSTATYDTLGSGNDVVYGISSATAAIGPYWMDDIGVSNNGPLGPVGGNIPPGDYGLLDSYFAAITTTF